MTPDKQWGVWFDGDGGKIPPHWLLGEDGDNDWVGDESEAGELASQFGGVAKKHPRCICRAVREVPNPNCLAHPWSKVTHR